MASRISPRLTNMVIAGVGAIVLLVFLLSYSETGSPPDFNRQTSLTKHSDYFLINTETIQFDSQGLLDTIASSENVQHNPKNDIAELLNPSVQLYRDGALAWTLKAQAGEIHNKGSKVILNRRVTVVSSDQQTRLKTPQLTVFPQKKLAKTKQPVTLLNPNGFTRSIGLDANLQTREIKLLKQVRSQYQGLRVDKESLPDNSSGDDMNSNAPNNKTPDNNDSNNESQANEN
jgi:lipopolysaccharide export system protein LptC